MKISPLRLLLNNKFTLFVGALMLVSPFISSFQVKKFSAVLLCLFVVYSFKRGQWRVSSPEIVLFCFSLFSSISVLWSGLPLQNALTLFLEYSGIFIVFVLVLNTSVNQEKWKILAFCYLVGCFFASWLVFKNWQSGILFVEGGRFSVDGVNNNYIAYSFVTAFPVLMALLWEHGKGSKLVITSCFFFSAILGLGVLLTASRIAVLSFLLCLIFVCVKQLLKNPITGLLITFLSSVLIASFYSMLPWFIQSRLSIAGTSEMRDYSTGRLDLWTLARDLFHENPFFGSGAGAFSNRYFGVQVHNVFLSILAEFGLVGLALYVLPIILVFWALFEKKTPGWCKSSGILLLLAWLPIALTGVWQYSPVAWFAFAWFYKASFLYNTSPSKEINPVINESVEVPYA